MDVFDLRERVVDQYEQYVRGFLTIRDPDTRAYIDRFTHVRPLATG